MRAWRISSHSWRARSRVNSHGWSRFSQMTAATTSATTISSWRCASYGRDGGARRRRVYRCRRRRERASSPPACAHRGSLSPASPPPRHRAPAAASGLRRPRLLAADAAGGGQVAAQPLRELGDLAAPPPLIDQNADGALPPGNLLLDRRSPVAGDGRSVGRRSAGWSARTRARPRGGPA